MWAAVTSLHAPLSSTSLIPRIVMTRGPYHPPNTSSPPYDDGAIEGDVDVPGEEGTADDNATEGGDDDALGWSDGCVDGYIVGIGDGYDEAYFDGMKDGYDDGRIDGMEDGYDDGRFDGTMDGCGD